MLSGQDDVAISSVWRPVITANEYNHDSLKHGQLACIKWNDITKHLYNQGNRVTASQMAPCSSKIMNLSAASV